MREWVGGRNPVYELLRAGRRHAFQLVLAQGVQEKGRLRDILRLCEARNIPVERASRSHLDSLVPSHQGVVLEVNQYPYVTLPDILNTSAKKDEPALLLFLDTLQDPQNLATLLRTAEVVGVHGVLLPLRRTATVTPAVVNASSGASEHLLIAQANLAQAIATLKENDFWVIGLEGSQDAKPPTQINLDGPLALVVGSEGQGLRPLVRSSCDMLMRLPMRGHIDSLNAAVAGSIALYLAWQARGFPNNRFTRS